MEMQKYFLRQLFREGVVVQEVKCDAENHGLMLAHGGGKV